MDLTPAALPSLPGDVRSGTLVGLRADPGQQVWLFGPAGPASGGLMESNAMRKKKIDASAFEELSDICAFCECGGGVQLRLYQQEAAQAIVESVLNRAGQLFAIMFPRQSGKNELQAQIEAYLLACLHQQNAEIVKISPTFLPQTVNAMRRLERVFESNTVLRLLKWVKEGGYTYRVGRARIVFLSGGPEANIVGATASTLLEVDEAQDVQTAKYDKDISPMAASTNATKVFWGTAWTSQTLLYREMKAGLEAERRDGIRRVWKLTADDVGAEVPAYKTFVAEQVAKLGRSHPLVRTQFFSEEIDSEGGMFPPARRALMAGTHQVQSGSIMGSIYCGLLDLAGEDEGINDLGEGTATNPGRDSTALTIVRVDLSTLQDPIIGRPTYQVVNRYIWQGIKQTRLYSQILGLAAQWNLRWLVVDGTGVGAGLVSFLSSAMPGKVLPFIFTGSSKSQLGWDFIAIVESGRWKEHTTPGAQHIQAAAAQAVFLEQLDYCQYTIQPGPEKRMKWSVPDGTRSFGSGELVHDDLILSAALAAELDKQEWSIAGPGLIVQAADPLKEMDRGY